MRYSDFPAYTILGSLQTNYDLVCRALMLTNTAGSDANVTFTAEVWALNAAGTRDTANYGDYTGRTYKSITFTVSVKAGTTITLPLSLKKVTSLTNAGNVLIYVLQ